MKKKYVILLIIGLLVLILVIPIRRVLKDGGSVEYKALIYKITKLKELNSNYENNTKKGTVILIFGKKVYEKIDSKRITYFIDESISLETGTDIAFTDGLLVVKKDGKEGFINRKGEFQISPIYDTAFPFVDGITRVKVFPQNPSPLNSGRMGYIDKNGNQISEIEYGYANDFSEGFGHVCLNEIESLQEPCTDSLLIDENGNVVIDYREKDYYIVNNVSDGLISAKKDGKYGFVDTKGNVVIDFKYEYASYFKYGYAIVKTTDGKSILIDKKNVQILDLTKYESAYFINDKLIAIRENDKWGAIDITGEKVIDTIYNNLSSNYKEYLIARITLKDSELINDEGELVLDLKDYDMVGSITDGLISVRKNDKWGFIDLQGKKVIDMEYERCGNFSEGLAYVVKDGKEMFINKKNEVVLAYK